MYTFFSWRLKLPSNSCGFAKQLSKKQNTDTKINNFNNNPSTHFSPHASLCRLRAIHRRSVKAVHTGCVGTWHAHLRDGGDYCVVPVAFANQVDYPVCDVFNRAPVQAMVISRLEVTGRTLVRHLLVLVLSYSSSVSARIYSLPADDTKQPLEHGLLLLRLHAAGYK